ncbi:MAG TPA: hypothetical protein VMS23_05855 [Terrimicrobiaceae bacterium]|nr:hypothetical protein [Terrimicrobiaceae bacterium]
MLSTLRLLIAVSWTLGAALAQEGSPMSAAEASPPPTPPPAPAALSEPSSVPAPPPPASDADVIPMEGGAPLETKEIGPAHPDEAMPEEPLAQPNAIIPDERPAGPPAVPPSFESAQEKARQVSIRYREVRVQAEKDPKVVSLFEQAERAKTFEDQRAALREYYRLLFKKIASIDKSLAEKCKVMEVAYIRRLAQERLEPTIPMNPPPTPEPLH